MAIVQNEATRRTTMNPQPDLTATDNHVCLAQTPFNSFPGESQKRGALIGEMCDHCKKTGHTRNTCWHLHPHLRPTRGRDGKGSSATRNSGRKGESQRRFGGLSENPRDDRGNRSAGQEQERERD
jgi:hypothetical protein